MRPQREVERTPWNPAYILVAATGGNVFRRPLWEAEGKVVETANSAIRKMMRASPST